MPLNTSLAFNGATRVTIREVKSLKDKISGLTYQTLVILVQDNGPRKRHQYITISTNGDETLEISLTPELEAQLMEAKEATYAEALAQAEDEVEASRLRAEAEDHAHDNYSRE